MVPGKKYVVQTLGRPGVSFIGNEAPAFLKFAGIFVSQFN
jgi:hypothetical protein